MSPLRGLREALSHIYGRYSCFHAALVYFSGLPLHPLHCVASLTDHHLDCLPLPRVRASLTEVQRAICGDVANRDSEVTPLFRLQLMLEDGVVTYRPSLLVLSQMVRGAVTPGPAAGGRSDAGD